MFKTMDGVSVYTADEVYNKEQVEEKLAEKADASEINNLVNQKIDSVIASKVNEMADIFENTVDSKVNTAINTELAGYDDSDTVDSKINAAIANIPSGPSAMTTSEATALIDQYL